MTDPRDILWNDAYALQYDTQYDEMLIAKLLTIWSRVDAAIKVLVALTASGSAIAGWALWKDEGYKQLWGALSGTSAIFAILSTSLGIQNRLKEHAAVRQKFTTLRTEIELLRHKMALDPNFDVQTVDAELQSLKRKYTEHLNGEQTDILVNGWLESGVQAALNKNFC